MDSMITSIRSRKKVINNGPYKFALEPDMNYPLTIWMPIMMLCFHRCITNFVLAYGNMFSTTINWVLQQVSTRDGVASVEKKQKKKLYMKTIPTKRTNWFMV